MLSFVLTIGQCAFVGLYGSTMRKMLYDRSFELKEAYKRIEELAELDELTGSSNRRCIMRMLEEEIARADRSGSPCSIALIDLDWFKRINDAYGHPTGDEVLRTFSITMFANIRSIDRFGRYGGEEFLLVLPDMDAEQAARALDRLRAIVADLDWSAFSPGMKVTISAGVATLEAERDIGHIPRARRQRALRSQGAGTQPHHQRLIIFIFTSGDGESVAGFLLQDRVMSSKAASTTGNLLDELQSTLAHGTVARRVETLRRVTDLFINGAVDYSDEQVGLFDDVFQCLIDHIETSAKTLLANRLAPIDTAPPLTIRTLAFDDVIEVAGPVLSQSMRLDDKTLIENARSKSQAHLMAISTRKVLSGAVTDVLVQRGNDEVVQSDGQQSGRGIHRARLYAPGQPRRGRRQSRHLHRPASEHSAASLFETGAKASDTVRRRLEAANPQQAGEVPTAVKEATRRARSAPSAVTEKHQRSRMRWSSRSMTTAGSTSFRWPRLPRPASSTKPSVDRSARQRAGGDRREHDDRNPGRRRDDPGEGRGAVVVDGQADHQHARRTVGRGADRYRGLQGHL